MTGRVSDILKNERLTPPLVALALLIAALMGAAHAFTPGHGKTVMAAYLIGERGTVMHALVLGVVVTITHVWSILALGMISLYATEHISETTFTFWTAALSGGIIVLLGLFLLRQRYTQYVLARYGGAVSLHHHHGFLHDHGDGFEHSHEGGDVDHGHSHVVQGVDGKPPTYRRIMWLGVSGGIVPCPAALIVLLTAINIGRLPLGLALILSFSVGLAAVLVMLGILVVRASGAVQRRLGTRNAALLMLPVASALLITLLGVFLVVQTLIQHNVIVIPG
jgi:ABC-type nickel/cobalt efflux system permease component RcnA